ncbi:MAG: putative lipid II flippase FtsW [Patescibacteria group bacterium]|jgi:cell division protein FtsW
MHSRRRNNSFIEWFLQPFTSRRTDGHQPDFVLLIIIALLLFFGLVFLSSASSVLAFYEYQDTYRFVKQQIIHGILPGLLLFYIAIRINYIYYKKLAWLALLGSFGLLILVFFTSLGSSYSAQSWIVFGSISFQPSELVKLFLIIFLAAWFEIKGNDIKEFKKTTIPFIIIIACIGFLIIKQPDIGTLSIIGITALAMYYVAGARLTHLGLILAAASVTFVVMIKAAPYRMNRIVAWLNPNVDPQGIGWQIKQSLIAVGSGGWMGLGIGSSRQKSYLPQPANDSIFAIIAEEIGFLFSLAFIILFIILIHRGFQIVRQSDDTFAKLLALGITTWMALQIFINIGGMLKLMPLTGVTLPFMSLGGTNLVVTLLAMGILANISKFTNQHNR